MEAEDDRWTVSAGDGSLTVVARGAETVSMVLGGRERLWQPRADVWRSVSPLLFPIVGRLRGGLTVAGTAYPLEAHGFARRRVFQLMRRDAASVTLADSDDSETRALWPFAYRLEVTHRATAAGFASTYVVENRGDVVLPFSLGAHPGFALPIASRPGWSVRFSEDGCTGPYPTYDRLLDLKSQTGRSTNLALRGDTFRDGAIYFGDAVGRTVTVVTPEGDDALSLRLGSQPWLALWSVPGADLLCLEPLHGTTDAPDATGKIEDKRGIVRLAPGEWWTDVYEVVLVGR